MKKFLLLPILTTFFITSCGTGESTTSQTTSPSAICSNGFLAQFAETKLALKDWLKYGSVAHETYANSTCESYLEYSSHKCKIDCSEKGAFVKAACPEDDGATFNGEDIKNSCNYFLSL